HMKANTYDNFFVNFANKTRFDIINALRTKPMSVNELSSAVSQEQSKVSHNLKKLAACHILHVKQAGKQRIYSLNSATVAPILKIAEQHITKNCLKDGCPKGCRSK
ncbi:MAG TPA: metalloregulator ArsR/SmtB family transcription factor, partial [Candidatus Nanoarchaeia archaeon]|nr:metalloregulator ArsR/SmtB family transcription factor [Candidatus Nanoarchaeia archaeon]